MPAWLEIVLPSLMCKPLNIQKTQKPLPLSTETSKSTEKGTSSSQPASVEAVKKPKKEGYKKRMMKKYGLTSKQYETEKKQAHEQLKHWETHKKEQAIKIFESKSSYISKSAKSDLKHPSLGRSKKVMNSAGQMVDVEFGKVKEHYLYSLAPNKEWVEIRTQAAHENALNPLREKQKQKNKKFDKSKQSDKNKLQTEYENFKTVQGEGADAVSGMEDGTTGDEKSIMFEEQKLEVINMATNSTDDNHGLFTPAWYRLSISRSQITKGKLTYWIAANDDEVAYDDDPEGKWTVNAEKVMECCEMMGGRVKGSGVIEPKNLESALNEDIAVLWERYKKTSTREICYTNTLKGTIDFAVRGRAAQIKADSGSARSPGVDISFSPTVTTYVFKGKRLTRQKGGKALKNVDKHEEAMVEIKRENREEDETK
uniref:Uncharacterized protein n=1 Tax=Caenorhabditis japonica TaxID=281687 RepID=A0A8R1DIT9_CAEJA